MASVFRFALSNLVLATALAASLPAHAASSPATAQVASAWRQAQQLILVVTPGWDASGGRMQAFERLGEGWRATESPVPVTIGRSGAAWGRGLHPAQADGPQKREGDGRAPAGVFTLGEAFGYAAQRDTGLTYAPMQASHYCIDVPASPLYNRIVDSERVGAAAVEGSTEPMRRDLHADGDVRYKEGFVIQHNPDNVSGAGSCIFAHLWKAPGEPTAGCTAMAEPMMDRLLAWLDDKRHPVFVLLPEAEYRRLRADWQLPAITEAAP
ncbi:L,D-transpeptidase family protein [Pseudoxanthomonas sp. 22568]|uniref:L,D-transpeptidase family protein n=1 Tax=Pseudoxanthomonas sp. 22568 TaxID=3453945 RepID=UPI003F874C33